MDEYLINDAFKALADPTRRALLARIAQCPSRVTELAEAHPISFNSVSKHLRVLERAGLVSREVRGREHWFALRREGLAPVADWVTGMATFWNGRLDALAEVLSSDGEQPAR